MRPLGKLQLERLMGLASPSCLLIVGDKISKSLVKRGLLKPNFPDGDIVLAVPIEPDSGYRPVGRG